MVNEYRPPGRGEPPLYHVDLYRVEGEADLATLGLEEVLESGGVVLVEWAEKLEPQWGRPTYVVTFEDRGGDTRLIRVEEG
jgi:tRNA threonylcarbamoyladenosine biosynthesis protein TsaE